MEGLSRKLYLKLPAPTEADSRSSEARILSALRELGYGKDDSEGHAEALSPL